jgi:hypothetical protein
MTNQTKDDELNGITSTEEYDKWVNKLPKDRLFTITEVSGIVAVANFWKLQEQAKEIIEMIDMIPVPESMKGNPKVIWTFAEVNRVIREKYGVKEKKI